MSHHEHEHHKGLPRTDEQKAELRGKGKNPDRAATPGEALEFSSEEGVRGEELGLRGHTTAPQERAEDEARYRAPNAGQDDQLG